MIPSGTLIATHDQTNGTGRFDRPWIAPPHTNLCFSIYHATNAPLTAIPSLTMATTLAVYDFLRSRHIHAQPKWPNDLLVRGKKICGILSEHIEHPITRQKGIITGVGLNVNLTSTQTADIDQPATSMLIETHTMHALESTLDDLIPYLSFWFKKWQTDYFKAIRTTWEALTGPIGRPLNIRDGNQTQSGTLAGYGENGELLLQTQQGIQPIWSGEIPL